MNACMCVCACARVLVCEWVHVYVRACVCVRECVCVRVHMRVHYEYRTSAGQKWVTDPWSWTFRWVWTAWCERWALNLGPQQGQHSFLTAEPSAALRSLKFSVRFSRLSCHLWIFLKCVSEAPNLITCGSWLISFLLLLIPDRGVPKAEDTREGGRTCRRLRWDPGGQFPTYPAPEWQSHSSRISVAREIAVKPICIWVCEIRQELPSPSIPRSLWTTGICFIWIHLWCVLTSYSWQVRWSFSFHAIFSLKNIKILTPTFCLNSGFHKESCVGCRGTGVTFVCTFYALATSCDQEQEQKPRKWAVLCITL